MKPNWRQEHSSNPRTIKGPCFDCNDPGDCWCGWGDGDICACHSPLGERTNTAPKIEPETRPNVPPNWLSFHPDNRNRFRSMPAVVAASVIERKDSLYALWGDVIRTPQVMLDLNDSRLLDGAKWSRRETPADPFEEGLR